MQKLRAEVISIGDELTSGARVDTNSQWISQQLGELGIVVAFHTTVGDDLDDHVATLRNAADRVDIVVSTGGLGPTADDLTRQAIATAADSELKFDDAVWHHIQNIFSAHNRRVPDSNKQQCYFPDGAMIVRNPEGTAPGIDIVISGQRAEDSPCRIFALPGVPAEMKQMWQESIEPALRVMTGQPQLIHHHVLHCFGEGESHIESMLPDLIRRGREPRVGITASSATISLRITAKGDTRDQCVLKMAPTVAIIKERLGDLVYGENNQSLQEVVVERLRERNETLALMEIGTSGQVAHSIGQYDGGVGSLTGSLLLNQDSVRRWLGSHSFDLVQCAQRIRDQFESDYGVAVGPIVKSLGESSPLRHFDVAIDSSKSTGVQRFPFSGHSALREIRSVKQVLNQLRLELLRIG